MNGIVEENTAECKKDTDRNAREQIKALEKNPQRLNKFIRVEKEKKRE